MSHRLIGREREGRDGDGYGRELWMDDGVEGGGTVGGGGDRESVHGGGTSEGRETRRKRRGRRKERLWSRLSRRGRRVRRGRLSHVVGRESRVENTLTEMISAFP